MRVREYNNAVVSRERREGMVESEERKAVGRDRGE